MSLLAIRDLSVAIHGLGVLDRVSLDVDEGEIVAITGESGSGKSMTALGVMALLPRGATATGSLMLAGRDVLTTPEHDLCAMRGIQPENRSGASVAARQMQGAPSSATGVCSRSSSATSTSPGPNRPVSSRKAPDSTSVSSSPLWP